jgi:polyferredoxin
LLLFLRPHPSAAPPPPRSPLNAFDHRPSTAKQGSHMHAARAVIGFTTTRRLVQLAFLALVLVGVYVMGANCERWCPFGGVEALYTYATEGNMLCSLGTANFFILGGVLLMTLLVRRAFCGYMCPIGTLSEWLRVVGQRLRIPAVTVPYWADRWLALLKYVVLAIILWLTWRAGELIFRGFDPCYALISRHGTDITFWAYVVAGIIVVASLIVMLPFCRWFCPLAAVLSPFSRFGFTRVKRDEQACSNCGLCAKSCPVTIPVHEVKEVKAARCLSCMKCVEVCPDKKSQALTWGPPRSLGRSWPQAALIAILLLCTSGAVAASYLFPFPSFVKAHGEAPPQVAKVELKVDPLHCRGNANMLYYFLERDDMYQVPGYFKVEVWPDPGVADVHITFDPSVAKEDAFKRAITEPYYDVLIDKWRMSPFRIEGYDPLAADLGLELEGLQLDGLPLLP